MKRKRSFTERFLLPANIVRGIPRTTLYGGSELLTENHAGLKSYTRQCIEIKTRDGVLRVLGDDLELSAMTKQDIVIRGFIVSIDLV